jgi:flavin reductase (DIM6/NTAB) family NADH-FMN oxidoreductase RutF
MSVLAHQRPSPFAAADAQGAEPLLIDSFKRAMRHHAGAVTIITTAFNDVRHGMTATAVTSLTAEPPTLLACVNRSASMHGALLDAGCFCVNILAAGQESQAAAFSSDRLRARRFRHGGWERGPAGLPYLPNAHAQLFCLVEKQIRHATHTVLFGRVIGAENVDNDPLVYHAGRYNRLLPVGDATQDAAEHSLL